MDIRILLDPHDRIVTTGDVITGRVLLRMPRKSNVSSVDVKLKGYIRTCLPREHDADAETSKPRYAEHVFLKLAETLFSPPSARNCFWSTSAALSAGQHAFPFQFRLPATATGGKAVHVEKAEDGCLRVSTKRAERGLPPSFTQVSDGIEIVYCIEATAKQPDLFKTNLHAAHCFNFRPIEQAWDPIPRFTSIKHHHQFSLARRTPLPRLPRASPTAPPPSPAEASPDDDDDAIRPQTPTAPPSAAAHADAARDTASILLDARLPAPAVLTRNRDMPLLLTVRRLSAFRGRLHLQSLHATLIGYTTVTHHAAQKHPGQQRGRRSRSRENVDTWVITSASNLRIPLAFDDPAASVVPLPPAALALLADRPVPGSVAPSFDVVCRDGVGVARVYELEVTLGLAYESEMTEEKKSEDEKERGDGEEEEEEEEEGRKAMTRTVWVPLRQKVEVYADFPVIDRACLAGVSLEKQLVADRWDDEYDDQEQIEDCPTYEMATATTPRSSL